MHSRSDLIYYYDGSFDGLLCCVFESYACKELPHDICPLTTAQPQLFDAKVIPTDLQKTARVLASIPQKMGISVLDFIKRAFLTCLERKELYILLFLRLGYRYGASVLDMLADEVVNTLYKAVTYLNKESHLLTGFVRFSIHNNVLVAEIEPNNFVLPLMARHFCERYPEERFLIHDKTHGMGLVYQPYKSAVIPISSLDMPEPDAEELAARELWRLFYDTIAIQGRYNPKCRMSHMPKRYWKYMTEFGNPQKGPRLGTLALGEKLLNPGK